jgi:hypothetical protein
MMYTITATYAANKGDWVSTGQVPTFFLDSTVQGMFDEEHAKRIAADVLNSGKSDVEFSITAVARPDQVAAHVDDIVVDSESGSWFLVYRSGEGFLPWTLAVRTDNETSAEEAWIGYADAGVSDVEDLVVRRISLQATFT